jgi:hypothetical protein
MYLRTYLRNKLTTRLIPLLKKDKCEVCGATDDLEVHHVKLFSKLLDETLAELGLEYRKEIEEYSTEELNLITYVVLGKHLDIKYLTLCDNCHDNIHEDAWKEISCSDKYREHCNKLRLLKSEKRKKSIEKLIPYLKNICGEKLFKDEKKVFQQVLREHGLETRTSGINSINKYLKENNLSFIVESKEEYRALKIRGKLYWIVKDTNANTTEHDINQSQII